MRKSSKLTEEEVKHAANLARLVLSPQEIKKFQKQLTEVLGFVGQLKKVKTKGVEPTSQVTRLENVFRDDKKGLSLTQKEVLSSAPATQQNFFKIKAVLEK